MTDKRVGTINPDGSRIWPAVNIVGADYERSASTLTLDNTHFVVLPVNFDLRADSDDAPPTVAQAALAELQAKYAPPAPSRRKDAADGV